MPIANANMTTDAKVRQWITTSLVTLDTTNGNTFNCFQHSRRVKLKKLRIFVSTTLVADCAIKLGYAKPGTSGTADDDAYLTATAGITGSATTAAGTTVEIDLAGQLVPANYLVQMVIADSNAAGVISVALDYELADDNSLQTE